MNTKYFFNEYIIYISILGIALIIIGNCLLFFFRTKKIDKSKLLLISISCIFVFTSLFMIYLHLLSLENPYEKKLELFFTLIFIFFISIFFIMLYFQKVTYRNIFCLLVFSGIILFWGNVLASANADNELQKYFIPGTLDDFYTPMMKTMDNTYIDPHYSDYPPLANLIYQLFRRFISDQDLTISENMETRLGGSRYLSNTMGGKLIVIIFFLLTFLLFYILLEYFLDKHSKKMSNRIFLLILLFSGPFTFVLQRGNNIIIPVLLISFYLIFYESENKFLRELSLISLAIATALKIYPVFFGIALLKKKNYAVILRAILYGTIAFFGFFIFYGGIDTADTVAQFIQNLLSRNAYKEETVYGYNYNISFYASVRILATLFEPNNTFIMSKLCYLLPLIICLSIYILSNKKWQKLFSICLFMTWLPSASYTYLICFFTVPLLMYLEENTKNIYNIIYLLCFSAMFIPYGLERIDGFFIEALPNLQITWGMIILHSSIWIMVITLLTEITQNVINRRKRQPEESNTIAEERITIL